MAGPNESSEATHLQLVTPNNHKGTIKKPGLSKR